MIIKKVKELSLLVRSVKNLFKSRIVFSIISLLILFLGYSVNFWKATDYEKYFDYEYSFMKNYNIFKPITNRETFKTFDRWSESLVLSRLIKSRKEGLLSEGGLVGTYLDNATKLSNNDRLVESWIFKMSLQFIYYLDESYDNQLKEYTLFISHPGGQSFILGVLDKILPFNNITKLQIFYYFNALLSTIIIFLIILWFYDELGRFMGWFLSVSFSLMCYPTLYAKNLWWVLWAFYIPFLLILYLLKKYEKSQYNIPTILIYAVGLCGMFFKILLGGFEFISTTIIMTYIPLFYYYFKYKWDYKVFLKSFCALSTGIISSIFLSLIFMTFQFAAIDKSFNNTISHLIERFKMRTYIDISGGDPYMLASVKADLLNLIKYYFMQPPVFDFNKLGIDIEIRIIYIVVLYLTLTFAWLFYFHRTQYYSSFIKIKSLIICLWISILAPVSWFIIFKGHSYIHKRQDPIVWFMPFIIYGMALVGVSISNAYRFIISKYQLN